MSLKILLLDPAFAAIPIHEWMVSSGYDVWFLGNRANDPLAISAPNRWISGDYSNVDLVKNIVKNYSFDAVVPGCTDVSMDTFARLNFHKYYNNPIEINCILNDKLKFRTLCAELNLPAPKLIAPGDLTSTGWFICKPVDSFSGRGVSVFDASISGAASTALAFAREHSPTGNVICEEFINGQLYSFSCFIESGKVAEAFSVKEGSRYIPFAVDTSYLLDKDDVDEYDIICSSVEILAKKLSLCDGLLHIQYIKNKSRVAIIEATRRCPGDLYSMLIEYSTGFPFAARYASYFIDKQAPIPRWNRRHILRHTIKQIGANSFNGLQLSSFENVFRVLPLRQIGEPLIPTNYERTALAFMEFDGRVALEKEYIRLTDG